MLLILGLILGQRERQSLPAPEAEWLGTEHGLQSLGEALEETSLY